MNNTELEHLAMNGTDEEKEAIKAWLQNEVATDNGFLILFGLLVAVCGIIGILVCVL